MPPPKGCRFCMWRASSLRSAVTPFCHGDAMKITGTKTQIVELPADEPLAGAAENPNGKRPIVTLRVATDAGVEGVGVSYFGGALTRTLAHAIDELGSLTVGEDPVL